MSSDMTSPDAWKQTTYHQHALRLAHEILSLTVAAHEDIRLAEAQGNLAETAQRWERWGEDLYQLCNSYLSGMQTVIDRQMDLINRMLESAPPQHTRSDSCGMEWLRPMSLPNTTESLNAFRELAQGMANRTWRLLLLGNPLRILLPRTLRKALRLILIIWRAKKHQI